MTVTLTLVADQYCARVHPILLRKILNDCFVEKRAAGASERTVRLHKDTFVIAEVVDILLREVRIWDAVRS